MRKLIEILALFGGCAAFMHSLTWWVPFFQQVAGARPDALANANAILIFSGTLFAWIEAAGGLVIVWVAINRLSRIAPTDASAGNPSLPQRQTPLADYRWWTDEAVTTSVINIKYGVSAKTSPGGDSDCRTPIDVVNASRTS